MPRHTGQARRSRSPGHVLDIGRREKSVHAGVPLFAAREPPAGTPAEGSLIDSDPGRSCSGPRAVRAQRRCAEVALDGAAGPAIGPGDRDPRQGPATETRDRDRPGFSSSDRFRAHRRRPDQRYCFSRAPPESGVTAGSARSREVRTAENSPPLHRPPPHRDRPNQPLGRLLNPYTCADGTFPRAAGTFRHTAAGAARRLRATAEIRTRGPTARFEQASARELAAARTTPRSRGRSACGGSRGTGRLRIRMEIANPVV